MSWFGIIGSGIMGGMQSAYSGMNRQQEFLNQQHLRAMSAHYQQSFDAQQHLLRTLGGNPESKGKNCENCGAPRNVSGCSYCGTQ